jgi:hypothetical protein
VVHDSLYPLLQSFVFVSILLNTVLEFSALLLLHRIGINDFTNGPVALVYAILYQYSRIVPAAYNYRIFGVPLTNKSTAYVLALQVRFLNIIPFPTKRFQLID